jgi:hypothetical protein
MRRAYLLSSHRGKRQGLHGTSRETQVAQGLLYTEPGRIIGEEPEPLNEIKKGDDT